MPGSVAVVYRHIQLDRREVSSSAYAPVRSSGLPGSVRTLLWVTVILSRDHLLSDQVFVGFNCPRRRLAPPKG